MAFKAFFRRSFRLPTERSGVAQLKNSPNFLWKNVKFIIFSLEKMYFRHYNPKQNRKGAPHTTPYSPIPFPMETQTKPQTADYSRRAPSGQNLGDESLWGGGI
ncbi:TPA: hypothetical protein ACFP4Y_000534 [Neisseria bacilliformis]